MRLQCSTPESDLSRLQSTERAMSENNLHESLQVVYLVTGGREKLEVDKLGAKGNILDKCVYSCPHYNARSRAVQPMKAYFE